MTKLHVVLASLAALAWVPVLIFFFRNFEKRKNPISLAIGTQVVLVMLYIGPVDYWLTSGSTDPEWVFLVFDILSMAVCIHFYLAIRWANRKFHEDRSPTG